MPRFIKKTSKKARLSPETLVHIGGLNLLQKVDNLHPLTAKQVSKPKSCGGNFLSM